MPGGDGTGPNGLGSRTGRAMGYCVGYNTPGYMNPGFGRGRGFGRGFRRRFFNRFPNPNSDNFYEEPITKEEEIGILGVEARELESELKRIKERLKTLESKE